MPSLPTVAQIAQAAQVSPATVSRVLNHRGIVRGDTYNRVVDALRRLGYPFSEDAPRQAQGGLIILNAPSFENPFYSEVIAGAKTAAASHGYDLLFNPFHINQGTLPSLLALLGRTKAVGLITLNHIPTDVLVKQIGRASCRDRVCLSV